MSETPISIADELAQGPISHAARPIQRRPEKDIFLPWHKPRKHWIRTYQWGRESLRLIDQLGIAKRRPLRYLTLPGPDMLDVRSLHDVCLSAGATLSFVGYIQPSPQDLLELELSEAEVRDLVAVDSSDSRVVRDDFQSLRDQSSVGTGALLDGESFDVINVDLCKSVGEFEPDDKQNAYYESLKNLFALQVKKRRAKEPWLFFITTRSDSERVSPESRTKFLQLLVDSCRRSDQLAKLLQSSMGISVDDVVACSNGSRMAHAQFEKLFGVAFGHWMVHLLSRFTPQVKVSLLNSSRAYGVRFPRGFDMLSLAFRCEMVYQEADDLSKLTSPVEGQQKYDVDQSIGELIELIAALANLDTVFASRKSYHTLTELAAPFMARARFDAARYREWAWRQREAPAELDSSIAVHT